ncbi:hypothetical protein DXV76_20995 [Rhodobacteraceae bacterium CCMM004]|nr:hypothetical protein DXV76_20995 [Rhodobacteraceae bacterium CCMM004]
MPTRPILEMTMPETRPNLVSPPTLDSPVDVDTLRGTAAGRGRLLVDYGIWAASYFAPHSLSRPVDWTANPTGNRSWAFLLHSFSFVPDLLAHDAALGGTRGRDLSWALMTDWWAAHGDLCAEPPMAWHDHATALRAHNWMLVAQRLREDAPSTGADGDDAPHALPQDTWHAMAARHAEALADPARYSRGTNHGFDQSMVLYELAADAAFDAVPELRGTWGDVAVARIAHEIGTAFGADHGHRENSVLYHEFGLIQLLRVQALRTRLAEVAGLPPLSDQAALIDRATLVMAHMIGPDTTFPLIGDTVRKTPSDIFRTHPLPPSYPAYDFARTGGERGAAPGDRGLVCRETGWFAMRSDWGDGLAVSLLGRCGYRSPYHRQDDDQSFTLKGWAEDWIIDGGLLSYEEKTPMRRYMRSWKAHSLSAPTGVEAARDLDATGAAARITTVVQRPKRLVLGTASRLFGDYVTTRDFEIARQKPEDGRLSVVLTDTLIPGTDAALASRMALRAKGAATYVTRFLLPDDKRIAIDAAEAEVRIAGTRATLVLSIQAAVPPGDIRVLRAVPETDPEGPDAWRSRVFGEAEPAQVLEIAHTTLALQARYELRFEPV